MKESSEAFRHIYEIKPVKQLADEIHAKQITLYRWGELGEQHRTNPVEYISMLTTATGNLALVECICHKAGGNYVPNLPVNLSSRSDMVKASAVVSGCIHEFGSAVSHAVKTGFSRPNVQAIRRSWSKLKSAGEAFVHALEVLSHGHRPSHH